SDAVNLLLTGADEAAERGETLLEAELLYEVARVGDPRVVAARIKDVRPLVDSPLAAARADFVAAAAARDAGGLAQVERRFAALGVVLAAAEAAAQLGRVLHADGRPRDAQGAALRSAQYLSGLVPVATPLLMAAPGPVDLSPREREIAELAAGGMASKAIAQRLGLSVRTVSNHLQNAYLKLGVSGRDELADTLGVR
ncbi:MAG TPA: helix-turn-helix transcriptional regulator, partial [Acidimicrobiaceae bacterium]|nr:helix-turn-helix transcriptional regulator [Acidimicrobiaceae bacterium]